MLLRINYCIAECYKREGEVVAYCKENRSR